MLLKGEKEILEGPFMDEKDSTLDVGKLSDWWVCRTTGPTCESLSSSVTVWGIGDRITDARRQEKQTTGDSDK